MDLSNHLFTLCVVLFVVISLASGRILPDIIWDSRNPIFGLTNSVLSGDPTINVRIRDRVNIHCPMYNALSRTDRPEHSKIYMVSQKGYDTCTLDKEHLVAECKTPFEQSYVTMVFREYTPKPNALEFTPGETYYFISTSNGFAKGIDNMKGGLCARANMKLKVHVLPKLHHRNHHSHHKTHRQQHDLSSPNSVTNDLHFSTKSTGHPSFPDLKSLASNSMIRDISPRLSPTSASREMSSLDLTRSLQSEHRPNMDDFPQAEIVIYELSEMQQDPSAKHLKEGRDYVIGYSNTHPAASYGYLSSSASHSTLRTTSTVLLIGVALVVLLRL